MPQKSWAVGEEVLAADFNTYLQNQVVPAFTGVAQRDSQWTAPPAGALCVTTDTNVLWQRIGGAWVRASIELYNNVVTVTGGSWSTTELVMPGTAVTLPNVTYAHRIRYWLQLNVSIASVGTVDMHVRYNTTGAAAAVTDTLHRSARATFTGQQTITAIGTIDRPSGATTLCVWGLTSGPTATTVTDATVGQFNVRAVLA